MTWNEWFLLSVIVLLLGIIVYQWEMMRRYEKELENPDA